VSEQHGHDTGTGELGAWLWAEDAAPDLWCSYIVRARSARFVGFRGVCSSWDSGELDPKASSLVSWQLKGKHAVSPMIDLSLAKSWPGSSCGFDEWYFFRNVPDEPELSALCSWGVSFGEASALRDVPSGFDVQLQLDRYKPQHAVPGDGHRLFLVTTKDRALLNEFVRESRRRRTRG